MTVKERIAKAIGRSKEGTLFFNNSFPEFDDVYVREILTDLCRQELIVRISQGIYVKPMRSRFGIVYPAVGDIVKGIAKRDKAKILPTGNTALNQLGLSEQVPMNSEYITSGSAREIKLGKRTVRLRRSVPKNFEYKGEVMPVLVQAMKAIGQENLTDEHRGILRKLMEEFPEYALETEPMFVYCGGFYKLPGMGGGGGFGYLDKQEIHDGEIVIDYEDPNDYWEKLLKWI